MKQQKVVKVVGLSFCGSSILNLVLDSHPSIYGGGELHKLFHPSKTASCSMCGVACAYWSPEVVGSMRMHNLYHSLGEMFGKRVVVDSSKAIEHFAEIEKENEEVHSRYFLLIKHPIRHVASFTTNQLFSANDWMTRINRGRLSRKSLNEVTDFALAKLNRMLKEYGRINDTLTDVSKSTFTVVRYEDFVSNPRRALSTILNEIELAFDSGMMNFQSLPHHPIGGNNGPHFQMNGRRSMARSVEYRRDWYSRDKGISLDNKFRSTFTLKQLRDIYKSTEYKDLCDLLDYSYRPRDVG